MSTETNYENRRPIDSYAHIHYEPPKSSCGKCMVVFFSTLGIITAFFLILAAHQVLPRGVNAISSLGNWGYVLSWGLMGLSLLAIACVKVKSCLKERENLKIEASDKIRNETSFALTPLSEYAKSELFTTKDHYCFVIAEYKEILKNQFCFYNPYTQMKLKDKDIKGLLENFEIRECWEDLCKRQKENAAKISKETIEALKTFAQGCHNKEEILQMSHKPTPVAQGFLDTFSSYYLSLNEEEKNALDDLWVPQSNRSGGNTKTMKFRDLFCSMDQLCVHALGDQIVLLVLQLDSEVKFDVKGMLAQSGINLLQEYHKKHLTSFSRLGVPADIL